ncbi:MAG: hypothetical protein IPH23_14790 [Gammaproteobacteria bacterium]|nr:hypothetical protein [Gammaproteobacteria bacterium]
MSSPAGAGGGFPVGTSMDTNFAMATSPALTRERYQKPTIWCASRRETEPLRLERPGTKCATSTPPKPTKNPPPIHIPGGGSVETYDFCLDNVYSYSYLSFSG